MNDAASNYDVIILGGGAAGLMCALTAGQRGRSVLVLEGANKVGKKILMSGGGRCNFTNLHCEPGNFISGNPHFCKSALSRYTQWDFIAMVEKHGIAYHEKTLGQLFCDNSSKDILNMLLDECRDASVDIVINSAIDEVVFDERYEVSCAAGLYATESLVIATGGLSIPRMGATDFGFRLARQFGLNVLPTSAALVPFTFSGELQALMSRLSGVAVPAIVSNERATFSEDILFTHRGLSGPAILQLSSYWRPGESIAINLCPNENLAELILQAKNERPKTLLRSILMDSLPRALVLELQNIHWPEKAELPLAEFSDQVLQDIAATLHSWELKPTATEGYRTAEVTLGGVDTDQFSSQTMQCNSQSGLYCIGEVLDVTGHLGGFNFQWAWSSGYVAGNVV